jgi:peptidoglycan/xylan/chitin deacetylase (PgdA/CDA1 family)
MKAITSNMWSALGLAKRVKATVRTQLWRKLNKNILVIPNWHQVSERFDAELHHVWTWTSSETFERQLDYLSERFAIIPLEQAIDRVTCGNLRGRLAALTFDDGDVSMANYVLPILKRRKLPATFFINTAYLEQASTYWFPVFYHFDQTRPDALPVELRQKASQLRRTNDAAFYDRVRREMERYAPKIPNLARHLVSGAWLSSLDGEQFAIGAHGHEHQRYSMMTTDWQRQDLCQNVAILRAFKAFRPFFAVPFGRQWDWTDETIAMAKEQGLRVVIAGGSVITSVEDVFDRIPSDGREMRGAIAAATMTRPLFAL